MVKGVVAGCVVRACRARLARQGSVSQAPHCGMLRWALRVAPPSEDEPSGPPLLDACGEPFAFAAHLPCEHGSMVAYLASGQWACASSHRAWRHGRQGTPRYRNAPQHHEKQQVAMRSSTSRHHTSRADIPACAGARIYHQAVANIAARMRTLVWAIVMLLFIAYTGAVVMRRRASVPRSGERSQMQASGWGCGCWGRACRCWCGLSLVADCEGIGEGLQ